MFSLAKQSEYLTTIEIIYFVIDWLPSRTILVHNVLSIGDFPASYNVEKLKLNAYKNLLHFAPPIFQKFWYKALIM